jgi:hypothetical protein
MSSALIETKHSTTRVFDAASTISWPIDDKSDASIAPAVERRQSRTLTSTLAAVATFFLHFLEMSIAMGVGMAIFGPVKAAMVAQGYTILLDRSSIDYQAWMNLFMVVPMVLWMRARGHGWRHGVEMGAAMIVPVAAILFVCSLGIEQTVPWFTVSLTGIAMFAGMLGYMLYRRDMYTGGYSLGWIRRRWART